MKQGIALITLIVCACSPDDSPETSRTADSQVRAVDSRVNQDASPYDFAQPSLSFVLPDELMEISGLTMLPDGRLGAIQDEEGTLYVLNRESGTIEARIPFGEKGDYEGIEWVGEMAYVLRSDGTIIELSGSPDDLRESATYETSLKRQNDTEGLGFDRNRGTLLIACKEEPGSGLDDDQRAIYAFDPATGELESEPAFVINTKEVEDELPDGGKFKPSAVAVHPTTGDVYVLSASDQAMIVLRGDGTLKSVTSLKKEHFEQPEGLVFAADGTAYIASEGGDGPAMLYEFRQSTTN